MRSWKFDYKNMSLLVIRHMTEQILTFGFPGNVGYRLVSWASIVKQFPKIIEHLLAGERNSIVRPNNFQRLLKNSALTIFQGDSLMSDLDPQ